MKAIETYYKGYRFRSRLEARWAVFFDSMGIRWEYEREGFDLGGGDRYLPDFYLYVDWSFLDGEDVSDEEQGHWFEVKPTEPGAKESRVISKFAANFHWCTYMGIGIPGDKLLWSASTKHPLCECDVCPEGVVLAPEQLSFLCSRWTDRSDERIEVSIRAAKSARFEHGERGAH